jgi:hypothetical protein
MLIEIYSITQEHGFQHGWKQEQEQKQQQVYLSFFSSSYKNGVF